MSHLYWLFTLAGSTDKYFTAKRLFSIPEWEIINPTLSSDVLWVRLFPLSSNLPSPGIINISHLSVLSKGTIFNLKGFFSLPNFPSVFCRWKLLYECKFHSFIQSFIQLQLLINMIRLVSVTAQRLTDSIWDLMVTKSFMKNSAGVNPSIERKHISDSSNYVLALDNGVFLWYFTKDRIFIYESQKYVCFTSAAAFRQKETFISMSFNK